MNASIFEPKVIRDNNILTIKNCNHAKCVSEFLKSVQKILEQGYSDIIIKSDAPSYFPNACVPICGIINFYRTREAGLYLRNDIENTLRRSSSVMVLDFKNVKTVSSSFIDELIAKMVMDLGFVTFNSAIRLSNMDKDIKFLCERSLYMRIHDSWKVTNTPITT